MKKKDKKPELDRGITINKEKDKPEESHGQRVDPLIIPKYGIQNLQDNAGIQVHHGKKGPENNDMDNLKLVYSTAQQPEGTMTWEQAKVQMDEGKCVRSVGWPVGQFMFLRKANSKTVDITPDSSFYPPITKQLLQSQGIKTLVISKHYNRWRGNNLQVGYIVNKSEKLEDWEEYVQ